MAKKSLPPSSALPLTPVVLVTCCSETSRPNIITLAWVGVACSDPPIVSIAVRPGRYSYDLIRNSGEFVINVPTADLLQETDFCGVASGKKMDKFGETGLTPVPADRLQAPLIKECPVNMECRVKQVIPLGSHDLFLGEVVALHAEEDSSLPLLAFCPGARDYRALGEAVGRFGFTKGKMG